MACLRLLASISSTRASLWWGKQLARVIRVNSFIEKAHVSSKLLLDLSCQEISFGLDTATWSTTISARSHGGKWFSRYFQASCHAVVYSHLRQTLTFDIFHHFPRSASGSLSTLWRPQTAPEGGCPVSKLKFFESHRLQDWCPAECDGTVTYKSPYTPIFNKADINKFRFIAWSVAMDKRRLYTYGMSQWDIGICTQYHCFQLSPTFSNISFAKLESWSGFCQEPRIPLSLAAPALVYARFSMEVLTFALQWFVALGDIQCELQVFLDVSWCFSLRNWRDYIQCFSWNFGSLSHSESLRVTMQHASVRQWRSMWSLIVQLCVVHYLLIPTTILCAPWAGLLHENAKMDENWWESGKCWESGFLSPSFIVFLSLFVVTFHRLSNIFR